MKRMMLLYAVLVGVATVTVALYAAGKPAAGVHPVVDAANDEFFGGSVDGKWVEGDAMRPKITGRETYRLYTPTRFVGTATGGRSYYSENDAEEFGALSIKITPAKSADVKAIKPDDVLIAVCGAWNALPRVPKAQDPTQKAYQQVVREILTAHGLPNAPVRITKLLRVDLEGDGVDEVILAATTPREPFPQPWAVKDDYSLVALRKIVRGKVVTIPLAENYFTRSDKEEDQWSVPNCYTLEAVLDVNGDGVMEIITGWWYYEGIGKAIYEIKDNKATRVLTSGWGV